MNNETIDEVARKASYKAFFGLSGNAAAIASKASFGEEIVSFSSDGGVMDGHVTIASTNVNGIAGDKVSAKRSMADGWDVVNGDARVFARGTNLSLYEKIKYTGPMIFGMSDTESYGVCEAEYLALEPLVGSAGFPTIITLLLLNEEKTKTNAFKALVGAPEEAHHAVNVAKKAIVETDIPKMRIHYLNFHDLAKSMAAEFPDFVSELDALEKEAHSGIHHRGFVINAKSSVDGSLLRDLKIEFTDYSTVKEPVYTDSMGNSPLITMRIGQWTVKCSLAGYVLQSFKPVFKENEVAYFDMIFVPI